MTAYISEVRYDGGSRADFIEVAAPTGTDLSAYSVVIYAQNGTVTETYFLGSVVSTIAGTDVYLLDGDDPEFATLAPSNAIALVDDEGNVLQFVSFGGNVTPAAEGPANGLTSEDIGSISGQAKSLESNDGGTSYTAIENENAGTVPCYAPGTMIDTPGGPRAVETLRPGDLVLTRDQGPQSIRWARSGQHPLEDAEDAAKPVQIKAGALGRNRPAHDLIVSPQHRILVGGAGQLQAVFWSEAFAPAKALTGLPGIRHMKGKSQITWVHFACDRHEVVTANGCVSESLLLGPMVVNGLTDAERRELIAIYGAAPTPDAALNGPAARECLNVGDVRRHLAKCKTDAPYATANDVSKWDVDLAMEHWEADALDEAVLDETYTLVCHRRCDYPADADMQSYRRN